MTTMQVLDLIARHTREILPDLDGHQFVASDRLVDLGANSVDRAEIAMLVQESLGLAVPRIELFGPKNIGPNSSIRGTAKPSDSCTSMAISARSTELAPRSTRRSDATN